MARERITLKSNSDILLMREAGLITAAALKAVKDAIAPGVSTLELDTIAESTIISVGAKSNFKLVAGYKHTICSSINDEVVHGIPSKDRILQAGDIISIDCGAITPSGWNGDAAFTMVVPGGDPEVMAKRQAISDACEASLWAGIAAWLKVARGVSEVISTIMLNFIAIGIISYIIVRTPIGTETSLNIRGTAAIPESGMLRGIAFIDPGTPIYGFFFISIVIGIAYWFLLNRTRFGFDLRATGKSATAARTSGVQSNRMIVVTMLLSGAVAGLVGLPYLLGDTGSYTLQFPTDWGFTGIAIALLGRNNPLGIALGAILWAFLDISSGQLILEGVPREISTIMQGLIVIVVVISYEVVRRYQVKSEQTSVAKALEKQEASV
ncbi:MAG: hypothetical protein RIT12_106 [Actinomycetota bacterium]